MATAAPAKVSYQIMPGMDAEQYAELKEDVRRNGVLVPIEYDQHGNIIDGHHRMRVVAELHAEGYDVDVPPAITRTYQDEESKLRFIVAFNERRRHLTAKQRQELVFTLRKRGLTFKAIGDMLQVHASTIYWDIQGLRDDEKAALQQVVTQSSDGRAFPQKYAPRVVYSTGQSQLRDMQQQAINRAAGDIKKLGFRVTADLQVRDDTDYEAIEAGMEKLKELEQAVETAKPKTAIISDEDAHKRISAFAWYGGKSSHLKWLLPLLPPTKHFVDVFGGSAAVLMNRDPSPIETYNDLDSDLVTFFRVLREQPDELARLLHLTPYSREERRIALEAIKAGTCTSDLERARQFFVLARQTRGESQRRDSRALNSWKFTWDNIQRGMAAYLSQWESGIDGLAAVASRMKRVQIENYPWQRIFQLYDGLETLFYCDPPYLHETREYTHTDSYTNELTTADHEELSAVLHNTKGLVALSGYPSALYDKLYADWHRVNMPVTSFAAAGGSNERTECLWTNYRTLPQES